jgi:plasmid stabilization system protein ParE
MRRLIFAPEAAGDSRAGYRWYEEQRQGLGSEFERTVEAATARILREPEVFKVAWPPFHRIALRRFPFEIYYYFDDSTFTIAMVFHTSRDPAKIKRRLGPTT